MNIRSFIRPLVFIVALLGLSAFLETRAQNTSVIRMTGARFTYPLVENWIDQYSKVNPNQQIIIEWRGTQDPSECDILIEAYEHTDEIKKDREYFYLGRYAILPVANSKSAFARSYVGKGLTSQLIKQIYFSDIYADKDKEVKITAPFTTYTRLQKAGPPIVFAKYFKYEQKDITGKGIAGSDEHLLKAILRDSSAVSYLPTPVIYERSTGAPVSGLTPIPVDINGNDRIGEDEKVVDSFSRLNDKLTNTDPKNVRNVPTEYIHLSVVKKTAKPEALAFIRWVVDNKLGDLKDFGFLPSDPSHLSKAN